MEKIIVIGIVVIALYWVIRVFVQAGKKSHCGLNCNDCHKAEKINHG